MKNSGKQHILSVFFSIPLVYLFLILMATIFYLSNRDSLGLIEISEYKELIVGFLRFSTANVCYTFGLFIAFSLFPFSYKFLESKKYKLISDILYILGTVMTTVTNLSDSVYFHYTRKRFTADEFFFLGNSNNTVLVLQFAKDHIFMVVSGIIILAVWTTAYIRISRRYKRHIKIKNKKVHYVVRSILFVVSIFAIIIGMRGGINRQTRPITISNAAQYVSSPEKGAIILSNPFCILRTIENKPTFRPNFFKPEEVSAIFSTRRDYNGDSLIVPSQKGKNVIIFILESFSAEHSKKLYPKLYDKPLTPFLDSLMSEGYLLSKTYANGCKSIDALPSILASIPSLDKPFATLPEALSPTDALGTILKKKGYSTWFFNGSERSSMGYVAYSKIAGIENFRTKEDYEEIYGNGDFDGYWGIWDKPFFRFMAETLDSTEKPFLSVLFSLTSHHPFVVPEQMKDSLPEGFTKEHRPVAYVDYSIRKFFDYAKTRPWYRNTVFVFIADHVSSEKYSPIAQTTAGSTHIMHFYYTPDGSLKGNSDRITQQIDIMPSVATLMDAKGPMHCFGHSIFTKKDIKESFAINYTEGGYQWIEKDTSFIFNGEKIVSVYDLTKDPTQKRDISDSTTNHSTQQRIKAFLQVYYDEIKDKKFTIY